MSWTHRLNLAAACGAAMSVFGACGEVRADCCLTDWLFGTGRTTYTAPYVAPTVYAPPAQCGCAPAAQYVPPAPVYAPRAAYRIAYRPVATVAYLPVTSVEPCSGCAVTMYQPSPTWTYYGSLVPYTAAYAAPACSSCGGCSSCGCAVPSGYSPCGCSPCGCSSCGCGASGCPTCGTSYGGCSSCSAGMVGGYVVPGGCPSCSAGVSGGYVAPGGCSSCTAGTTVLPGPAEMSQPPAQTLGIPAAPMTSSPTPAATLGQPAIAPSAPGETPPTYAPHTVPAPVAPGAPGGSSNNSTDTRSYRVPTTIDAGRTVQPPRVEGIPPLPEGPQLSAPPAPQPAGSDHGSDRVTSQPAIHAGYFQLLPSPPSTVPAQTVGLPKAGTQLPADDGGWGPVK